MPVGDGVFFRPTNPSSDQRPVMNQPRDANKHPKTSLSAIILGTSIMTNKRPSYVILSDSHLKHIPQQHYDIYTIAKSGLQWIDRYDTQTSAQYKVATEHAKLISTRDTIVLAIGTNTLRHTKFVDAIEQVKNIISLIRKQHQHLSFPSQIIVTLCFACKKESAKFPTAASLSDNIDQYNRSLISLAATSHFTVIDCGIQEQHIANDKIHINVKFRHLVFDAILNQLDHNHLLPSLLMPPRSRWIQSTGFQFLICTSELATAAELTPEFEKRNVKVIDLSCDTVEEHHGWVKDVAAFSKIDISIPIIDDADRAIASRLGMIREHDEFDNRFHPRGLPMAARGVCSTNVQFPT
ncbi:unnamed protein product, partial [Didymodactylos carnosus]